MEKEFEALQDWLDKMISHEINIATKEHLNQLKSFLTELKAIKEAKPSEALEAIYRIIAHTEYDNDSSYGYLKFENDCKLIEQYILKAQEQEQVLEIIKEKNVDIWLVNSCFTVEQYNFSIIKIGNSNVFTLTPEEFDLLKRWVEND